MSVLYEDLRDKHVLVTGGAGGLGFAIAEAFVSNHCLVGIVGRTSDKLEIARKKLGGNVQCIAFDLNDLDQLPVLIEKIVGSIGQVDILVNNAGIHLKKEATRVTNREYQDVVQTNQTAVFALTRELARPMIARKAGNIIMISSMASHYGIPSVIAYTASKSAIEGMTRALAVEWSPHGVRINCIAPGFIATDMSARALGNDPERKKRVLSRTPLGRLGKPSDVANAALFLASSQSKYITGIVLPVDGGNSIGF